MAEPRPPAAAPNPDSMPDGDRDRKIEQLLLAGLDHYFAGELDLAISVWTRVLFLDRGHARARAYLERARSALAERHRESEELLHTGMAAFDRGEGDLARRLLTKVVERGGPHDVALAYLERLERLDAPAHPADAIPKATGRRRRRRPQPSFGPAGRPAVRWGLPAAIAVGLAVAAVYLAVAWPAPFDRPLWPPAGVAGPSASTALEAGAEALPVPGPGDLALTRGRALFVSGHLREALRVLEEVPRADPRRVEVDRLRAAVQRALILGPTGAQPAITATPDRPPAASPEARR